MHSPCVCGARAVHTRAQARVACACTLWHAACGTSMCTCACTLTCACACACHVHVLTPGCRWESGSTRGCTTATASKSSTASSCGTARQAPRPPPTHTTLTRGQQACPSLTGKPHPKHRTSRSPSASTRTRASRTMSTRDQHSCAHRVTSAHKFTSLCSLDAAGRADAELCRGCTSTYQHARQRVYVEHPDVVA